MSYTLRGRLETRAAGFVMPLAAAGALALVLHRWWPLELAALMIGVGVALDACAYHRLLPYQPGWAALPLGLLELALVMALARAAGVAAPLRPALAFYALSWLLAQALGHAGLPLLRLSYADDGGELGRLGPALAVVVLGLLAAGGGVAWATRPPTVWLAAGVHQGPIVVDRAETLVGAPGAVVRGGIVVHADHVTVRDVSIEGGEYGVEVDDAQDVHLERVSVRGASLDGIHVRLSQVEIRDCHIWSPASPYAQGIDVSFSLTLPPSLIEGCSVVGGGEGIVVHYANVRVRGNEVAGTRLRGITLTEMSMASASENAVRDALGIGIFCGDHSMCEIERNVVSGVRPDPRSQDQTRLGYAIVAQYGAEARLRENELVRSPRRVGAFLGAEIRRG